ncbi:hypothetical protein ABRY23_05965 [Melioribacteraceae bacterium 4301-Me]|uniref:hypothetical protein n=1 Tax=Pyranulibacter aquaticus TaxID=3163344 RepID=UPI003598BC9E
MKKFLIAISSILIILVVYFLVKITVERNKLVIENNDVAVKLNSFQNAEKSEEFFNGKFIWDVSNIQKNDIINLNQLKVKNYILIVAVDSIECYSCLQYNLDLIQNLSLHKTALLIYSPMHGNFINKTLRNGYTINIQNQGKDDLLEKKLAILFVESNGKILYSLVADKYNYALSNKFFNVIKRFSD